MKQVGKTQGGQPISAERFAALLADCRLRLELAAGDRLLDVCCGNGLVTRELARACRAVVGVDFSAPLVAAARAHHAPENVRYFCLSALDLAGSEVAAAGPFDKILMYEALQHFRARDLRRLLDSLLGVGVPECRVLLASVPDLDRRWRFYATARRRLAHVFRRLAGRDALGTWWRRADIARVCRRLGLRCDFHEQSPCLHTAHYRFDALIQREDAWRPAKT
jgi:2-polyprenyl-3-methyl-5-hydroxy-6-metoxy-1,4-benzoquinol methylase